jgi:hypothetical protein
MITDPPLSATYTKKTAALRLGVSIRQVNNIIESGELAHTRNGWDFEITEAAIRAYLDTNPNGPQHKSKVPTKEHPWRKSALGTGREAEFSAWEIKSMYAELQRYRKDRVFTPRRYWLQATVATLMNGAGRGMQNQRPAASQN